MLKSVQIMLIRALMLLCVVIFLDSCKLFRRKENTATTSSGKYPPKSTPAKKSYSSKTINEVVSLARSYTGVPYRAGGVDANGMDCSGLLYCVYGQLGFQIPRISWQQSEVGREISVDELKVGDWVFFVTNKGGTGSINHAGIITEYRNTKEVFFIHASSSKGIREDNLFSKYWMGCFAKAMRPF
ncbi:MAG: C40 family peptidase [Arcicella sp.]|jgi:cell wall-associated NlpC family hydrolase|nr:C40 family peptidase [Arcicella sp.]